ncbi:Arachidonate--CoA ligase [Aphelenchoides besseyi]|nr:Arachidonate--CoA ligase [Aphelenchoides besseyi]
MVGKDSSLWVLPPVGGRLADLAEWATNSTQSTITNALGGGQSSSLVYSVGAAAAIGMGWYMWSSKPDGKVRPLVDLNAQTRVLADGSRVCKYLTSDNLVKTLHSDVTTLYDAVRRGATKSQNGPMLGYRRKQVDGSEPYVWLHYNEVIDRSVDVAQAFRALGVAPGQKSFIGIYAKNRPEWIVIEHAIYNFNNVIVPLYETLGAEACVFIINQADIHLVVCDTLDKAMGLIKQRESCPSLHTIVVLDSQIPSDAIEQAKESNIRLLSFGELEKIGREYENRVPLEPPTANDLATICYTSGTTGQPKGVMLTHGNIIADGTTLDYFKNIDLGTTDVMMSFLPLAHMFERVVQSVVYTEGGRVGFFRGDIRGLPDDIKTLQPTVLPVVPRVLNRIYDKVMSEVGKSRVKKLIFDSAMAYKMRQLNNGIICNDSLADRLIFHKIREQLGGHVKLMITGSAPLGKEVLNFIRAALGCTVVEGYGQTEAVACVTITLQGDSVPGHVGVPSPCNSVKLVDVPELGYFAKDNAGEVCVRGANVFKGYFKNDAQTCETIDEAGWLHTGDIGQWTERGTLKIVDRKKHIFKLAQGEYVAPEKIESIYVMCPIVQQVYVDGHSLENSLVAIVVPEPQELINWYKAETGKDKPLEQICKEPKARSHVLKMMTEQGKAAKLNGIEQVKAVYLDPIPWSVENGMLTPTLKSKRPVLKKYYEAEIAAMYKHN